MSVLGSVAWRWREDPSPPEPEAAVAWHAAARALHARLAQLPEEQQERLQLCASRDVLIVTGAASDLPWVAGVSYAARCADAPALWRPTVVRPNVPTNLLARSLQRLHSREPLLLWPEPAAVIPLDRQLPVSPALLADIAGRWQDT